MEFDPDKLREKLRIERDAKIAAARKAIIEARQHYKDRMDAIGKVAKLAAEEAGITVSPATGAGAGVGFEPTIERVGRGWLIEAVLAVLPNMPQTFTSKRVAEAIAARYPDREIQPASVASTLGRMVNGRVRVVAAGSGQRATTFTCIGAGGESDDPITEAAQVATTTQAAPMIVASLVA